MKNQYFWYRWSRQFWAALFVTLFTVPLLPFSVSGQPVLGAQNTALGSGGTAYLSGIEAAFWNPANLAINDRAGTIHFGIGQTGVLYEPVLSSSAAGDQFFNFTDSFYPYNSGTTAISFTERASILDKNYPSSNLTSQHQTRADIILGGMSWQRRDATYTVAARARYGSRITVGRGWYSEYFVTKGDQQIRDFTLNQQINQLYELSFGYSRAFNFINGLFSSLNRLYIGIAPKVVLGGPNFDANYNGRYIRSQTGGNDVFIDNFSYRTTGAYSRMTRDYRTNSQPQQAINRRLNRELSLPNSGFGVGFDFGFTYIIPLGEELPMLNNEPESSVISKSLRIAFSINDIGMIRNHDDPLSLSTATDTTQINQAPPKESMFIGAGGQYLTYFDNASALSNPILNSKNSTTETYNSLLPTSLNAGVLLDFSSIKVMGDLTLGLNNTAFTSTKLTVHAGLEGRPVDHIPLRLGTRIAAGLPTHFGVGTGYESRYWDFNIGAQIILRSRTITSEFVGGAFAGLEFHL
jgi:hypothetical protein